MSDRSPGARFSLVAPRLMFFAVAATLALAGWLRPPLSDDIASVHLSLRLWGSGPPAEALLQGTRAVPVDSAGLVVLAVLVCGVVVVLARPGRFPAVAGVLLGVAIAANAAVALNHPALIERLNSEGEQRQQIVQVLRYLPTAEPLSTPTNGRIAPYTSTSTIDTTWADLVRPWDYLLYGRWLVVWAALGVWFGTRGLAIARWKQLASWATLGVILASGLCVTRLGAEYYWMAAHRQELHGELGAARESVRTATRLFPQLNQLQRTWLLLGKLDYLEARSTPAEALFRAAQLASIAAPAERDAHEREHDVARLARAVAFTEPLLADRSEAGEIARVLTAHILTSRGVVLYLRQPHYTDAGLDYSDLKQQLVAAQESWQHALQLDPARLDDHIYLSYTQTFLDPNHPALAEPRVALADRLLRADVLNLLGDAYFEAGQMAEARRRYAESLDLLNLPQRKNFRAQKGLGGL